MKQLSFKFEFLAGGVTSMDLNKGYLVYWDIDEGGDFIYRQDIANKVFAFHNTTQHF